MSKNSPFSPRTEEEINAIMPVLSRCIEQLFDYNQIGRKIILSRMPACTDCPRQKACAKSNFE